MMSKARYKLHFGPSLIFSMHHPRKYHLGRIDAASRKEFLQAIRVREQAQDFGQDAPPVLPDIHSQPLFVQQVHEAALTSANPPQFGEPFGRIESWYIDQQRHRRCHHTRIVELGPDFRTWEQQLRLEWIDHIDTNVPVEFHIVHPTPEDADQTAFSQVLLVQRADDQQRTIVLSIYDAAYDNGQAHSHAVVVPHRVDLRSTIGIADFTEHCPPIAPANDCQLWFGSLLIPSHQQIIVRHGYALRLTVRRPLEIDVRALQSLQRRNSVESCHKHSRMQSNSLSRPSPQLMNIGNQTGSMNSRLRFNKLHALR